MSAIDVRTVPEGASGNGNGRGAARVIDSAARARELHRVYLEVGSPKAAQQFGISIPTLYAAFKRYGLELDRKHRAPTQSINGGHEQEDRPERPARPGHDAVIHEGASPAPRTTLGALNIPCPNCGAMIEQTMVLRPAGSRRS